MPILFLSFIIPSSSSSFSSSISQLYTTESAPIKLLFLPTQTAVNILSPVAILTLICASSDNIFNVGFVANFNLF